MSVWHEVQIEFVSDAVEDIIREHGEIPKLLQLRKLVSAAWTEAEFTLEKNANKNDTDEAVRRLTESTKFLTQAENKLTNKDLTVIDEDAFRKLSKRLLNAKAANEATAQEIITILNENLAASVVKPKKRKKQTRKPSKRP